MDEQSAGMEDRLSGQSKGTCMSPHQFDASNGGTRSHPACPHPRQRQSGRTRLCFPSSGPFSTILFLSVVSGVAGGVQWPVKGHCTAPLLQGFSPFPFSLEAESSVPFQSQTSPTQHLQSRVWQQEGASSPCLHLAEGLSTSARWLGGGVGCGLPCLCLLDEPRSSAGGQRAMAGKRRASFGRGHRAALPSLAWDEASELRATAFPHLKRPQSRTEVAHG